MTFLDVRPPVDLVDPFGRTATRSFQALTDDGGHLVGVVFEGHPGGGHAAPKGEAAPSLRVTYRPAKDGARRYPTFPEVHQAVREADPDVGFSLGPFNGWEPIPPADDDAGVWLMGIARRAAPADRPQLVQA